MNLPHKTQTKALSLSNTEKLILMSDMHRGNGTSSDDFAHNSLIYKCALRYYLENGFTYIELGDAEELWENRTFDQIYITHSSIYEQLAQFHDPDPEKTRYIKIYGNHDLEWQRDPSDLEGLFPGIIIYEAALLDNHILMWHGHQADASCLGSWAPVAKFFVRGVWPYMQQMGFKDPTRAANNPGRGNKTDERLYRRATRKENGIDTIIAGHTHRPVFQNLTLTEKKLLDSKIGTPYIEHKTPDPSYYNTGSCVHPRCITGIEIACGSDRKPLFQLIKWSYNAELNTENRSTTNEGRTTGRFNLSIERTVLEP